MSIWKYKKYFEIAVGDRYQLTLKEGDTECQECLELAKYLKISKVYLKREDTNPTGSFKDRSIAYQISLHLQNGDKSFVISSSGNAGISSIYFCKLADCTLTVFVSKKIPIDKLDRLIQAAELSDFDHSKLSTETDDVEVTKGNITIIFSNRPRSQSIKFVNAGGVVHLRGSNDDSAPVGFKTIAYELAGQVKDADSIFIPCSSGTSTVGIYQGYYDIGMKLPQIHVVQTTKVFPIAKEFDSSFEKTDTSLASAISDKVANRKEQVIQAINASGGSGWVISDDEILLAQQLFSQYCKLQVSTDAALSLAGLIKALQNGVRVQKPVLIISGK